MLTSKFFKIAGLAALAWAGLAQASDFDLAQLMKLVETKKYKTMDQLLADLPEEMRNSFTLVYKSNSLQEASPMQPRAIVFSPDGKLVITFNGDSKQKGGNDIEVMAFDDDKAEFELREIHFDSAEKVPAKISEKNPQKCLSCHGDPVRPIWDHYPHWRGVYGAFDDNIGGTRGYEKDKYENTLTPDQEKKTFLKMREQAINSSRYKNLIWKSGANEKDENNFYPYYNLVLKDNSSVAGEIEGHRSYSNMPNTRLSMLLFSQNSYRVLNKIKKHPDYNVISLGIIYYINQCFNPELATIGEFTEASRVNQILESKLGVKMINKGRPLEVRDRNIDLMLKYLGAKFENDLDIKFKKYQGNNPDAYSSADGKNGISESIGHIVYYDLMKTKEDKEFFKPINKTTTDLDDALKNDPKVAKMILRYKSLQGPYAHWQDCGNLTKKMEAIMSRKNGASETACHQPQLEISELKPINELQEKLLSQNSEKTREIFKSCIECHDSNEGYGPMIQFADPLKLGNRLDKAKLKNEILRRISLPISDKQHMPIGSELSDQEKKDIKEFVDAL